MKSVITAMGNSTLNHELKRYSEIDVMGDDLFYQEAVIDLLQQETEVDVICLSGILQGQWDLIDFIERIQKSHYGIRIVVILEEMDSEMKCQLLEHGVQDIFLDDQVEVPDVLKAICREEPLMQQLEIQKKKQDFTKTHLERETPIQKVVQKQEVIAIAGANGSGKTTFAYHFSKKLADKTNSKILVIDLDILNGNLDEKFGVEKVPNHIDLMLDEDKKCGLNYASDLIKKQRFDANVLEEIVIHTDNLDLLTGNTSLFYCEECLETSIYQQIIDCAKEKYDFIILDTSSNIFLDATKWCFEQATQIIFLVENDKVCLKKSMQLLHVMVEMWGVWKDKIKLVLSKIRTGGLEKDFIERILNQYDIVGEIKQNQEMEDFSYERIFEKIQFIPKTRWFDYVDKLKNRLKNQTKKIFQKDASKTQKGLIEDVN